MTTYNNVLFIICINVVCMIYFLSNMRDVYGIKNENKMFKFSYTAMHSAKNTAYQKNSKSTTQTKRLILE